MYNKKSRKWGLHTLKVEMDHSYIADLQSAILCRQLLNIKKMKVYMNLQVLCSSQETPATGQTNTKYGQIMLSQK